MPLPLRLAPRTAAILAVATCGAFAVGGCASKPPQPESTPTASTPSPTPTSGTSASASPPTSSGAAPGSPVSATSAPSTGAPSATSPAHAQTSDERRAALDKRLNDSLGSFDAQLRKEQQKIAQERDARQATVATVPASDAGSKPASDQNAEAAGSTATEAPEKPSGSHDATTGKRGQTRSARAGDLKSDKGAGGANGNANGNGAVADEVPDGNDDDVVARRLRKAAEQETDPELKDKLWKEYVEYKKNTQAK